MCLLDFFSTFANVSTGDYDDQRGHLARGINTSGNHGPIAVG